MLKSACKVKGDVLFELQHTVDPGAKVSEGITAMKGKVMAGINAYIAAHNLRSDDVDVMEEDGGDGGEGEATGEARRHGKKRKHP